MADSLAEEGLGLPARGNRLTSADYKLIAVDLDGTLLDHDGRPHEADRRALLALGEAGYVVSILTGRLYAGTKATAEAIGVTGPVGCADGSHVVDHATGRTIMHHTIDAVRTGYFRDAFRGRETSVFGFGGDAIVLDARGEPFLPYMKTWSEDVRLVPDVLDHALFSGGDATAIVALGEEADLLAVRDQVHAACDAAGAARMQIATFALKRFGTFHGLLARSETATKGTALAWLAQHHGLGLDQTVCVGDWWNDVSMLEIAGCSFAMGQAPDDVKAKATRILEETSEHGGGIARVARELFGVSA